MKKTTDHVSGISFFGDYVHSTFEEMVRLFGDDGKPEWIIETSRGDIINICKYVPQCETNNDHKVYWQICAENKQASLDALEDIENMLYMRE